MGITITEKEIADRLQMLGYNTDLEYGGYPNEWSSKDKATIDFALLEGFALLSHFLNRSQEDFVEEMRYDLINIICSLFISSKRNVGFNADGSITPTGAVISAKLGGAEVKYDNETKTGSNSVSELDEMIEYLKTNALERLSKYRVFYNFSQWGGTQ